MPRPNPPPTPGSSTDLRGKEGSHNAAPAFSLPATAFQDADRASVSSSTPSNNGSDSSYRPVSPGTAPTGEASRKKPTVAAPVESGSGRVITKDDFTLPPPPTRSRKIIQMKPRESEPEAVPQSTAGGKNAAATPATQSATGGKRKSNAGTTAAGRKIARKTAHSLIERRRRSKMNEEFGVLKDMIPACKGQEMHKLAILQASIEYLRYLEQCVQDLQAQTNSPRPRPPPSTISQSLQDEEDSDEEMADDADEAPPPATGNSTPVTSALEKTSSLISLPSLSQITTTSTTSPSLFPSSTGPTAGRHYSVSSAAGSQASYSPYFHSNQTSPAFGPQLHHIPQYNPPSGHFGIGSPALKPMDSLRQIAEGATELSEKRKGGGGSGNGGRRRDEEMDHEATAALLMLNHDRRQWRPAGPSPTEAAAGGESRRPSTVGSNGNGNGNGGMSVRDLLSG